MKFLLYLLYSVILLIISIFIGLLAVEFWGLVGLGGGSLALLFSIPFIALGLIILSALILAIIFKYIFKTKLSWFYVFGFFLVLITLTIASIIIRFIAYNYQYERGLKEYESIFKSMDDNFILDEVNFSTEQINKTVTVELKYHFNPASIPDNYTGNLPSFIQAEFAKDPDADPLWSINGCDSATFTQSKLYYGDREMSTLSHEKLQEGGYRSVIQYSIKTKPVAECDSEGLFQRLNNRDFNILYSNKIFKTVKT